MNANNTISIIVIMILLDSGCISNQTCNYSGTNLTPMDIDFPEAIPSWIKQENSTKERFYMVDTINISKSHNITLRYEDEKDNVIEWAIDFERSEEVREGNSTYYYNHTRYHFSNIILFPNKNWIKYPVGKWISFNYSVFIKEGDPFFPDGLEITDYESEFKIIHVSGGNGQKEAWEMKYRDDGIVTFSKIESMVYDLEGNINIHLIIRFSNDVTCTE